MSFEVPTPPKPPKKLDAQSLCPNNSFESPVFLAWRASWEARGFSIVAMDTTSQVCTGGDITTSYIKKLS